MPAALRADDDDADDVREWLAAREGLEHLRVRRRADLLTLESGDEHAPIPHARFRRATVHLWTLECATHTGRWERTGFRGPLPQLFELLTSTLPWVVAPVE
jgi:hypothetical protein